LIVEEGFSLFLTYAKLVEDSLVSEGVILAADD